MSRTRSWIRGSERRERLGGHHVSAAWYVFGRLTRDRSALLGLMLIALLVVCALAAPLLATHPDDVLELHPAQRLKTPSAGQWLCPDRTRADRYSRLLFGARITIATALR